MVAWLTIVDITTIIYLGADFVAQKRKEENRYEKETFLMRCGVPVHVEWLDWLRRPTGTGFIKRIGDLIGG